MVGQIPWRDLQPDRRDPPRPSWNERHAVRRADRCPVTGRHSQQARSRPGGSLTGTGDLPCEPVAPPALYVRGMCQPRFVHDDHADPSRRRQRRHCVRPRCLRSARTAITAWAASCPARCPRSTPCSAGGTPASALTTHPRPSPWRAGRCSRSGSRRTPGPDPGQHPTRRSVACSVARRAASTYPARSRGSRGDAGGADRSHWHQTVLRAVTRPSVTVTAPPRHGAGPGVRCGR